MIPSTIIENRKARFDYETIEIYTCGMVLTGPEVCAIRTGKANIVDAYVYVDINSNKLILTGMTVTLPQSTMFTVSQQSNRNIDLLVTKKELNDIKKEIEKTSITAIPFKIYRDKNGYFKLSLHICKGKKDYDKRNTIKDRDNKIELDRMIKNF